MKEQASAKVMASSKGSDLYKFYGGFTQNDQWVAVIRNYGNVLITRHNTKPFEKLLSEYNLTDVPDCTMYCYGEPDFARTNNYMVKREKKDMVR
ncbi:hypothetical protein NPIL_591151 [Nephila pilipes]|uniref:Uncharacterized protein n=1 Tax=Nephila pilipes TaxID=299642 RepID=A0A8X6QTY2_NEPPI|nr:hypothetical protein NPIL_591151 [Nephila pilipes]